MPYTLFCMTYKEFCRRRDVLINLIFREDLPLWRKAEFSYAGGVVRSDKKYRNHRSRIRRNLWSGQRKRQVGNDEN